MYSGLCTAHTASYRSTSDVNTAHTGSTRNISAGSTAILSVLAARRLDTPRNFRASDTVPCTPSALLYCCRVIHTTQHTSRALKIGGRSLSNWTSTTAPITWVTRPTAPACTAAEAWKLARPGNAPVSYTHLTLPTTPYV